MRIDRLLWDDYRIEHVARHGIDPDEVWQACNDPLHRARREGRSRYCLYGQTAEGRHLFVVLEHAEGAVLGPITARNMTDGEKRGLRRLRE